MFEVILYYNFSPIKEVERFNKQHKKFCHGLGIKGRIYISHEGINGTVAGTSKQIDAYKQFLWSLSGFEDTEFKQDQSEYIPFAKLICKVREEIVSLHVHGIDPNTGGTHLEPDKWRQAMESEEDYVMIDVRNNYESKVGHFKDALTPNLDKFYDFPKWLDDSGIPKNQKVLMYCTGGIRCEKFSVLMKDKGWDDVNQLHGGILNYAKKEEGKHFEGKCFVFDDRLIVPVNPNNLDPISTCEITSKPADTYVNCANMKCNKLFICSEEGAHIMKGCCSEECKRSEFTRPFDVNNAFKPFRKWYNYFGEEFKQREPES